MNKAEAIMILEEVKMFDDSMYQYNSKYMDALNMAIEVLQTEAIPIKWLEERYPIHGTYGTESYFRKAYAISEVIKEWREKEKNEIN